MKVLFHTHLAAEFPERLGDIGASFPDHLLDIADGKEELFAKITDAEVLVDHRVTEELLNAAPKLRWLFVPFTGVNEIPWDLLESRGVQVSNNHGNAAIVAERALALALSITGRIAEFDRGLRRGYWHRNASRTQPFIYWESITRRPVSILGTGAIGRNIAKLLSGFDVNITGFRRHYGGDELPGFRRITNSLDEALNGAKLVFVTLPLTAETEGMIGAKELALLKDAYLVNVSRGPIVEEDALYRALSTDMIAGAALDVWYRYPKPFYAEAFPSEFPFHELENIVLSPHAGSHTPEGKLGQLDGLLSNLESLFKTGSPMDVADRFLGY